MKGLALNSLRAGKKYWLVNYGEKREFEILEVLPPEDFRLKDIHTLEEYLFSDIIRYGKGDDYEIREMSH